MRERWKKRLLSALLAGSALISALPLGAAALSPALDVSEAFAESVYCGRLTGVELTGDYRTDLVNVALAMVGYHEGDTPADYHGGSTGGWHNATEFGMVYGGLDAQWCAMFVSWCARQAGIPRSVISTAARASADGRDGSNRFWFHMSCYKKDHWQPQRGDLVFFTADGYYTSHVGIVAEVTDSGILTVEGNCMDAVRLCRYTLDDEYIYGYGVYAAAPEAQEGEALPVRCLSFVCGQGENGAMPDGTAYRFDSLYALPGRELTLPAGAFVREGHELLGYYVERTADGLWYCGGRGWLSTGELEQVNGRPELVADGASFPYPEDWGDVRLYCVWKNEYGARVGDGALPAGFGRDDSGWLCPYADLNGGEWYYANVREGCALGLLTGGGVFAGEQPATRAQFVTMLYRAMGSPETAGEALPFRDVAEEDWFCPAVRWAWEEGVVRGTEDGRFLPGNPMTREEMAAMLFRLLGGEAAGGIPESFRDGGDVSPWAAEAVAWAAESGLLTGLPAEDGALLLLPRAAASRAQALTLALRAGGAAERPD